MTVRTFGFVNWTITPDLDPDAPSTRHAFRCLTEDEAGIPCGAESDASEQFTTACDWTFHHLRDHPGHTSYAETVTRPWIMRCGGPA